MFLLVTSTGGMPSSHSAAVSSLIASTIEYHGFTSPLVAIATTSGLIVMFDAMGGKTTKRWTRDFIAKLYEEQLREESSALKACWNWIDGPINIFDTEEKNKKLIIKKYLGHKTSRGSSWSINRNYNGLYFKNVLLIEVQSDQEIVDIIIIGGGGPVGLFTGFLRWSTPASVKIIERALPELNYGWCYIPEKKNLTSLLSWNPSRSINWKTY